MFDALILLSVLLLLLLLLLLQVYPHYWGTCLSKLSAPCHEGFWQQCTV